VSRFVFCTFFLFVLIVSGVAQNKTIIQIKAFDTTLQPVRNLDLTLNKKIKINTGGRGLAVVTITETDLPVQTIDLAEQTLEAASWNFSRGVLEVVIRKKNYRIQSLTVLDLEKQPIPFAEVSYSGSRKLTLKTNSTGRLDLPVSLEEKIPLPAQFSVPEYQVIGVEAKEDTWNLILDKIKAVVVPKSKEEKPIVKSYVAEISTLDTVRNLSEFYAIIRSLDMDNIPDTVKSRIDTRFNQLLNELVKASAEENELLEPVGDTTTTAELRALIARATKEGKELERQRSEFDKRIAALGQRLSTGIANMDADTRNRLLNDIVLLENLLLENENRFRQNQDEYKQVISSLKEQYFDIQTLESKLSESEKLRLEEQRVFKQRLILALILGIIFAVLILMLARFSTRLRKQKKQLIAANDEVREINENLESIVERRTQLLQAANSELDTFLYRAAHDLRTPVASIFGLINLSSYLSLNELVDKVKSSTEKMDRLLGRLNVISQINHPTGLAELKVNELFQKLEEKFGAKAVALNVQLVFTAAPDNKLTTYASLISQVLSNLIENAIFFGSLGKTPAQVEVTATSTKETIQFTITDNGIGIDAETKPQIFKMFYKGYEKSEGHGLGLYIVHRCLSPMKGTIEVDSKPNLKTTFTVKFPVSL
jgi:signal transduction histidine kinase